MNKELLENYKLLIVFYGSDTGLVSLVTGDLLACAQESDLVAPADIPRCTVEDHEAENLFGDEHNWSDVIGYLQSHYDWARKNLPTDEPGDR